MTTGVKVPSSENILGPEQLEQLIPAEPGDRFINFYDDVLIVSPLALVVREQLQTGQFGQFRPVLMVVFWRRADKRMRKCGEAAMIVCARRGSVDHQV